jgi:large repetitive protein
MQHLRRSMLIAVCGLVLVPAAGHARSAVTQITTCGQTVTTNAVLTKDLGMPPDPPCSGSGVIVGASGITINLNGFAIRGDVSPIGNGTDLGIENSGGYDHVTVKNGLVRNFYIGISGSDSGSPGADHIAVANVVAAGNAYGVFVFGDFAKITSSTASGNGTAGIAISGAAASISSSTASGNGSFGIAIVGPSASVTYSTASGNGADGIGINDQLGTVKAALVRGNRAYGNGFHGPDSDLTGLGVEVVNYAKAPVGTNKARGNDDPAECSPASLC